MKKLFIPALCAAVAVVLVGGCKSRYIKSTDIMYGPNGEIVKMKSPDKTMKIKYDGDKVKIKGARGIGGRSRVRMPPVVVEPDGDSVGVQGIMVAPPSAPVVPVPAVRGQASGVEQRTIVY